MNLLSTHCKQDTLGAALSKMQPPSTTLKIVFW